MIIRVCEVSHKTHFLKFFFHLLWKFLSSCGLIFHSIFIRIISSCFMSTSIRMRRPTARRDRCFSGTSFRAHCVLIIADVERTSSGRRQIRRRNTAKSIRPFQGVHGDLLGVALRTSRSPPRLALTRTK